LGSTPQALFELSQRVYSFIDLTNLLPISNKFLWLNLAQPDPWFVLPVLVFGTMFLQQKLMTPATQNKDKGKKDDSPTAAMSQSMQWTMPIMFGFFSLQFQAGLSLYFVLSNVIGIGQSYYMRRSMDQLKVEAGQKKKKPLPAVEEPEPESEPATATAKKAKQDDDLEVAMKGTAAERKQYQSRKRTSKRKRKSR
jgi:membrane protein insertase Oxa1/YidC/SpoIIIJ